MATAGDILLDAQGNRLLDASGNLTLFKPDGTTCGCSCGPPHSCTPSPVYAMPATITVSLSYSRYLCKRATPTEPPVRTFIDSRSDTITVTLQPSGSPFLAPYQWSNGSGNAAIEDVIVLYACTTKSALACTDWEFLVGMNFRAVPGANSQSKVGRNFYPKTPLRASPVGRYRTSGAPYDRCADADLSTDRANDVEPTECPTSPNWPYQYSSLIVIPSREGIVA